MNSQPILLYARVLIVGTLGLAAVDAAHAIGVVQGANGAATKVVEVPSIQPVVLPDRKDVLTVDWVDTKNARLSVGGLMYHVRGAVPSITLADGAQVKDIGYLKKGARVKIQLGNDASGTSRLTDIHVVTAGPMGQGDTTSAAPTAAPVGGSPPSGSAGRPQ